MSRHRKDPAVAARIAGARGRHAQPTDTGNRVMAYWRQNRCGKLTARQNRRIDKKAARNGHRPGGDPE